MSTSFGPNGGYTLERWGKADVDAYCIRMAGTQLRWSSIPRALLERAAVRELLTEALRASEAEAFFWECAPWRGEGDPFFEFVLAPAPALSRMKADDAAFAAHFDDGLTTAFDSLGGDARLVAPCPHGRRDVAVHLARFVRDAPRDRIDALWVAVGEEIAAWRRARRGPLWLSTSGLGVGWLHVRLDSRPKYYTHAEYR